MRILHTSDWHLGHTLRDFSRVAEHRRFLDWLVAQIVERRVDGLLVAGDVFDTANPSAAANELWFSFLARLRASHPSTKVVVIAGNHDSPARIDAQASLLAAMNVVVIGAVPRRAGNAEPPAMLTEIVSSAGERAWVAAVPFLRIADLPAEHAIDAPERGVEALYAEVLAAMRSRRAEGEAMLAMGHLYMAAGELSELSERKILGGNQHALPHTIFPADLDYVALGHLHKAQRVGGNDRVRYSGSPLPLSMTEASYRHQVLSIEIAGGRVVEVESIAVPRTVDMIRVPRVGALPLDEALAALAALPDEDSLPRDDWPFVEVSIAMARPEPTLQTQVTEALVGRAARLVRISRALPANAPVAATLERRVLTDLTPEDVFVARHRRELGDDPPPALLAAFHELVDAATQERR
jgi:exonuclease SbcD